MMRLTARAVPTLLFCLSVTACGGSDEPQAAAQTRTAPTVSVAPVEGRDVPDVEPFGRGDDRGVHRPEREVAVAGHQLGDPEPVDDRDRLHDEGDQGRAGQEDGHEGGAREEGDQGGTGEEDRDQGGAREEGRDQGGAREEGGDQGGAGEEGGGRRRTGEVGPGRRDRAAGGSADGTQYGSTCYTTERLNPNTTQVYWDLSKRGWGVMIELDSAEEPKLLCPACRKFPENSSPEG